MAELKKNIPVQNFFCIGVQKAGTTTLAEILNQHSQIFLPAVKETKFFLFEDDFNKGIDFYNSTYFGDYNGEKISGEFDPDYIMDATVAQRLYNTYGVNLKFIVIFRHPVDRAYSHYLMTKRKGLEDLSFEDALAKEEGRKTNLKEQKVFAYKARSLYASQLHNYLKIFPRKNFLFLVFEEDIVRQLPLTIQHIENFLQISNEKLATDVHSNQAFEAKNEMMRDLVRRPNFVKQIFKTLIPGKSTRKKMRDFFISQNAKKVKESKLNMETRNMLYTEYFKNDIAETEELIQRKLNYN